MTFDRSYENTTKKYRKTYAGQKSHRKSEWKTKANMIFYDFDKEYDYFYNLERCELCNCEFTDKNKKCKDHDHLSRYSRFTCCNKCNNRIGLVDKKKLLVLLELHRYHHR
tara:strand:- start:122 stop:451 length:330 start_codon:yes stop_codon:yes gene_type:complete